LQQVPPTSRPLTIGQTYPFQGSNPEDKAGCSPPFLSADKDSRKLCRFVYDRFWRVRRAALSLIFGVLTGTVFGFYPAYKASRLVPVAALSAE
jgi:hypothetical protein